MLPARATVPSPFRAQTSGFPAQPRPNERSGAAAELRGRTVEDPLDYLPCSQVQEFAKGETIYGGDAGRPDELFLVVAGSVKVSRQAPDGRQVVIGIYQRDEFFGESAMVGGSDTGERAVALDACRVMHWKTSEIAEISARKPALALALAQQMVRRSLEFAARIESFSADNILQRLLRSLIRFAAEMEKRNDGEELIPFTHELLAQYVGTSREIVTHYMNQLRRDGVLTYSRRGISLDRAAAAAKLRS